jgi:tRNA 2-selenouridine synthase
MVFTLTHLSQLVSSGFDEIIDVRSPSEFAEDHLPGAINLPVLDDAERARVGTIYKQESPFLARKIGAALVARNAAAHIEAHFVDKPGNYRPLVYCWRGGMRSGSLATILGQIGWRAETLAGGYKSYRRAVVHTLYEPDQDAPEWSGPFVVLDGNTGTAKTEILQRLARLGVQVLDLEDLARHRGSLFGASASPQPPQKAFDSAIAMHLAAFTPDRPIILEAESSKIGALNLPKALWAKMRAAPRIRLQASLDARAKYLADAYADITSDPVRLDATLNKLSPYQPATRIKAWKALAADGDMSTLAKELMAFHYDPTYARQRSRETQPELCVITVSKFHTASLDAVTRRIASLLEERLAKT